MTARTPAIVGGPVVASVPARPGWAWTDVQADAEGMDSCLVGCDDPRPRTWR